MKLTYAFLFALTATSSVASATPGDAFNSSYLAAIDALQGVYDKSNAEGYEYAGSIYIDDDTKLYYATETVKGSACAVAVSALPEIPRYTRRVALYHTHPYFTDSDSENFSDFGDKTVAIGQNLVMYIMTPSHAIKQYTPTFLTADSDRFPSGVVYTNIRGGTPVTYPRSLPVDGCD